MDLLDKDKYILHGAADSIREHNRIHQRKERNAVFITAHLDFAADLIDLLADDKIAVVKHGRWLLPPNKTAPSKIFQCSECKNITEHQYYSDSGYYNYCKDCGAKMDKGE